MPQLCPCTGRHSPRLLPEAVVTHHSPPTSYPLKAGGVRVTHEICGTAHYLVHSLTNKYRAYGDTPPKKVLALYPAAIRDIAAETWDNADTTQRLPRTLV